VGINSGNPGIHFFRNGKFITDITIHWFGKKFDDKIMDKIEVDGENIM
jgi:hypothetical protein